LIIFEAVFLLFLEEVKLPGQGLFEGELGLVTFGGEGRMKRIPSNSAGTRRKRVGCPALRQRPSTPQEQKLYAQ
jgi:hypothetical protein